MDTKIIIHKSLANGRWFELSTIEQLANIGCDFDRAVRWKKRGDIEESDRTFDRMRELLCLTIADPKNKKRLRELYRFKEVIGGYFFGGETYGYTHSFIH